MRNERDEYGEPRERGGNKAVIIGLAVVSASVIGFAAWYFLAGGATAVEVIGNYRPQFADLRAKLKRIGENLPPVGSVTNDTLPANLSPKPVYDVPNKTFNTAIVMAEECADPDRKLKSPAEFDLGFHEDELLTHLAWTGDKNPMVESARKASAKDMAQRFERSLKLSYLVVARPVQYIPPRAVDDKTFTGGDLDLEVFLVDLPGEKVLGGFLRRYRPDQQVMVTFRKDRKENESAEAFVYSNLWSKVRDDVAGTLVFGTRGTFDADPAKR